jgi:anti-sigma B factor antagonist
MSGNGPSEMVSTRRDTLEGVAVLHVVGEVDMTSAETVRGELLGYLAMVESALVLDLSAVTFLASSGLALLIEASREADWRGIPFVIVAAHRTVLLPIRATSLDELLSIHPDLVTAVRATSQVGNSVSADASGTS